MKCYNPKGLFRGVLGPSGAGAALLLMICLSACPQPHSKVDSAKFFTGSPVLTLSKGTQAGVIDYSWTPAAPDEGVTYTLYAIQGEAASAQAVTTAPGKMEISVKSSAPYTGSYQGTSGNRYTFAVKAVKGKETVYSNEAPIMAPSAEEPEDPLEAPDFRFGVISDTHIGYTGRGSTHYPNHERLAKVLKWYNSKNAAALAIVGDITHNGYESEYDTFNAAWNANRGNLKLIAVMGNHDAYPQSSTSDYSAAIRYEQKIALADGKVSDKTNYHYTLEGYHFIVINGGRSNYFDQANMRTPGEKANTADENNPFYAAIKDWTIQQIQAAIAADPNKPVFLFLHHPLKNTFYVSDEWYTAAFGDGDSSVLNDYPQVVAFSGHIHSPNNDPRSIWQKGFTSVNTVTLAYMEMEKAGSTAKYLGDSTDGVTTRTYPKIGTSAAAQGMLISVKGPKVTIENWDFNVYPGENGERVAGIRDSIDSVEQITDQTWEFDVSKPGEFPYTNAVRQGQKTKPVFDSASAASGPVSGKIRTVIQSNNTSVILDFDQAVIPAPNPGHEVVHSYKFEFYKNNETSPSKTAYQWSDFMVTPSLQKSTYSQLIGGLTQGSTYQARIYAYGSFQAESTQYLTAEFTTGGTPPSPPPEYLVNMTFNAGGSVEQSGLNHNVKVSSTAPSATQITDAGTRYVAEFNGANNTYYGIPYRDNTEIKEALAGEFTFEAYFKPTAAPSGTINIISSQQSGGAGIEINSSSKKIEWWCKEGNTITSDTVVSANTWYHVAGTFKKNGKKALYVNGVKKGEINATTFTLPNTTNAHWFCIGGDTTAGTYLEGIENKFTGQIAFVRIYSKALTQEEVTAKYSARNTP
jgi:predicted phosphodiesterase